ncbi:MAG: aspartate aminotransferase family protein [Opitutaceae bacterium]|nr:aspartate aminotransferase family protein [Opitutaceae bacterium]
MTLTLEKSEKLLKRNELLIPGGLASLNRRADPCISFASGQGGRIKDYDGNEYIDYHFGFAPYILGHNDRDVNDAVKRSLESGLSNFGSGTTEEEGELAALFLKCLPAADKVQFLNTGSEATAQAIRVARAATGKSHIIKIQGSYNGHHNMVATNLITSAEALGGSQMKGDEYPKVPITAGTPLEELNLIHVVDYNDLEAVEVVVRRHSIAALLMEPVLQNIGVIKPEAGYLEGLRKLADEYGFLLIFDEVKTGFRAGLGGYQGVSGICPDLSTFGKAIANGYPISALAGRHEYMDLVISEDPAKRVLSAGTYNCHPVPVTAAIACLRKLMDPKLDVYGHLERLGARLQAGQEKLFQAHGIQAVISRQGSASCVYFAEKAPRNWWELLHSHDFDFDTIYRKTLIQNGVYHFPVATKQGSICCAHTEADIDESLEATDKTLGMLKK